jgi:hypothetical protein
MADEVSTGAERREFFRINDTVIVECKVLDETQVQALAQAIHTPHDSNSPTKNQLYSLQTAFSHLTDQINQYDRNIARALRLLDDKINIVNHILQNQKEDPEQQKAVNANLSGGGIAFLSSEEIPAKTALEINLELRPSYTQVHSIAHVVSCNLDKSAPTSTPYHLRLAFTHMNEVDRNLLVKHVLNRQAEDIRRTAEQLN